LAFSYLSLPSPLSLRAAFCFLRLIPLFAGMQQLRQALKLSRTQARLRDLQREAG
jgi:hypothetical protein